MKKTLSGLLCMVLLIISCSPLASAANTRDADLSFELTLASQLKRLGLFEGVGANKDGTVNFELNRAPTRVESVAMLVRALGKEAAAEQMSKTHPFTDVPAWADGYVSYAYDQQLAKGVSEKKFGSNEPATAQMYLTFLLRALGYTEGEYEDFVWDAPWALASWCKILPIRVNTKDFLRADVVDVTCAALFANLRGSETLLKDKLASDGVFTSVQFSEAFPQDPFADDRTISAQITKAIDDFYPLGMLDDNLYVNECHYITDVRTDNGEITVTVLVCYGTHTLGKENTISGQGSSYAPWLVTLDAKTLALKSYQTAGQLDPTGLNKKQYFSQETLDTLDSIRFDMAGVCSLAAELQVANGSIAYKQYTYEESLAKTKASVGEVLQTLETDSYTALLGRTKDIFENGETIRGRCVLYLIFKGGSSRDIGDILSYSFNEEEGTLTISSDGNVITYIYPYSNGNLGLGLTPTAMHELGHTGKGTVTYEIDLEEGVDSWKIMQTED